MFYLQNENFPFYPGDGTKALRQKSITSALPKPCFLRSCWGQNLQILHSLVLVMGPPECPERGLVSDCSVGAVTRISSGLSFSWFRWVLTRSEQPPSRDVPLFWTQRCTKFSEEIHLWLNHSKNEAIGSWKMSSVLHQPRSDSRPACLSVLLQGFSLGLCYYCKTWLHPFLSPVELMAGVILVLQKKD